MQFSYSALILAVAASLTSAVPVTDVSLETRADHSGLGTVYTQEGGIGSCGKANPDSSLIAAISNTWQGQKSPGPYCGRKIQIKNIGSNDGVGGKGKSVTVTVADTCPSCDANHVDLSVGAWNALTGNAPYGTVNIDWHFV